MSTSASRSSLKVSTNQQTNVARLPRPIKGRSKRRVVSFDATLAHSFLTPLSPSDPQRHAFAVPHLGASYEEWVHKPSSRPHFRMFEYVTHPLCSARNHDHPHHDAFVAKLMLTP